MRQGTVICLSKLSKAESRSEGAEKGVRLWSVAGCSRRQSSDEEPGLTIYKTQVALSAKQTPISLSARKIREVCLRNQEGRRNGSVHATKGLRCEAFATESRQAIMTAIRSDSRKTGLLSNGAIVGTPTQQQTLRDGGAWGPYNQTNNRSLQK